MGELAFSSIPLTGTRYPSSPIHEAVVDDSEEEVRAALRNAPTLVNVKDEYVSHPALQNGDC